MTKVDDKAAQDIRKIESIFQEARLDNVDDHIGNCRKSLGFDSPCATIPENQQARYPAQEAVTAVTGQSCSGSTLHPMADSGLPLRPSFHLANAELTDPTGDGVGVTEPSVHTLLGEIVRSPCDQAVEDSLTVVRDMTGLFLGGNSFRRDHPAHAEFCDNEFAPACADDFQIPSYCWEAGLGIIAIFSLPGE